MKMEVEIAIRCFFSNSEFLLSCATVHHSPEFDHQVLDILWWRVRFSDLLRFKWAGMSKWTQCWSKSAIVWFLFGRYFFSRSQNVLTMVIIHWTSSFWTQPVDIYKDKLQIFLLHGIINTIFITLQRPEWIQVQIYLFIFSQVNWWAKKGN